MDAVRANLAEVAVGGHVPTLPRPPVPPLRRTGLWRNPYTKPESNGRFVDLAARQAQVLWHPKHGPPAVARDALDEVCHVLRALYATLPLDRVATSTKTSRDGEAFFSSMRHCEWPGKPFCSRGPLFHKFSALQWRRTSRVRVLLAPLGQYEYFPNFNGENISDAVFV